MVHAVLCLRKSFFIVSYTITYLHIYIFTYYNLYLCEKLDRRGRSVGMYKNWPRQSEARVGSTSAVVGTKAASHPWSISDGSKPAQTTTTVAADHCPSVTWTDTPTCTAKTADIVGTKVCPPPGNHRWSLRFRTTGAPVEIECPDRGLMESPLYQSQLLGTQGLGACYTPGAVNNYQWVIPWMQCSRFTEDGFELPVAPLGKAMVWMAQTCVPVQ